MSAAKSATKKSSKATAAARKAGKPQRKVPVFGIAIAAVVVIGIAGIVLARAFGGDGSSGDEFGEVTTTGEPLPLYNPEAGGSADEAIGAPAPTLTGVDFDGETVEIADDGRAKIVVFLAHWCPVCQEELPVLSQWVEAGNLPDDVDLVAVSTGVVPGRDNYPPSDWFEAEGYTGQLIRDDNAGTANNAFGLPAFPYWVFIDSEGNVAGRRTGIIDAATLTQLAQALSGGATEVDAGEGGPATPESEVEATPEEQPATTAAG